MLRVANNLRGLSTFIIVYASDHRDKAYSSDWCRWLFWRRNKLSDGCKDTSGLWQSFADVACLRNKVTLKICFEGSCASSRNDTTCKWIFSRIKALCSMTLLFSFFFLGVSVSCVPSRPSPPRFAYNPCKFAFSTLRVTIDGMRKMCDANHLQRFIEFFLFKSSQPKTIQSVLVLLDFHMEFSDLTHRQCGDEQKANLHSQRALDVNIVIAHRWKSFS